MKVMLRILEVIYIYILRFGLFKYPFVFDSIGIFRIIVKKFIMKNNIFLNIFFLKKYFIFEKILLFLSNVLC